MIDSGKLPTAESDAAHTDADWPLGDGLLLAQVIDYPGAREPGFGLFPALFPSCSCFGLGTISPAEKMEQSSLRGSEESQYVLQK